MQIEPMQKQTVLMEILNHFNFRAREEAKNMLKTLLANQHLLEGLFFVEKAEDFPNGIEISTNNSGGVKLAYYTTGNGATLTSFPQFLLEVDYMNIDTVYLQINFAEERDHKQEEIYQEYQTLLKESNEALVAYREEVKQKQESVDNIIALSNLTRRMQLIDEDINRALETMDEDLFKEKTQEKKRLQQEIEAMELRESKTESKQDDIKYLYCFLDIPDESELTVVIITTKKYMDESKDNQSQFQDAGLHEFKMENPEQDEEWEELKRILIAKGIDGGENSLFETEMKEEKVRSLLEEDPKFAYSEELKRFFNR